MTWMTTVLILMMSIGIVNSAVQAMFLGEFCHFLGIRLMMVTCLGWTVDDFWSTNETQPDQENDPCPYNFCT